MKKRRNKGILTLIWLAMVLAICVSKSTAGQFNGVAICTGAHDRYGPQIVSDGSGGTTIACEDEISENTADIHADRTSKLVPVFSVPVEVACSDYSYTRTFGTDADGTDGFDSGLDIACPSPGMVCYAYFYINTVPFYLDTDIRSCADSSITWILKIVNATGSTGTITWNPDDLPPEGAFKINGTNMRTESSITFECDQTLYITYSELYEIDISTMSICGWNLVSVPVILDNTDPSAVFPGNCGVYTWDGSAYVVPTAIEPGVSYWICYINPVVITVAGTPVTSYTRSLMAGWNMIGSTTENVDFTDPNDSPNGFIIDGTLYWFDPATCAYVGATTIEPTKGYWVCAVNVCALTVSNPTKGKGEITFAAGEASEPSLVTKSFASAENLSSFYAKYGSSPPPPPYSFSQVSTQLTPRDYALLQSYPNPFYSVATINYQLPKESKVILKIYSVTGQLIRTLVDRTQKAGHYKANWDGKNESGKDVSGGIYFYKIQAGTYISTEKVTLLR